MNSLKMNEPQPLAHDLFVLSADLPVLDRGVLPINAFLLRGPRSTLVDTGLPGIAERFVDQVEALLDGGTLDSIFLTHTDPDHVGALRDLLIRHGNARLVTNFLAMGKLDMHGSLAPERFFLLNPGQELCVGEFRFRAVAPPSYDAPETMAYFEETRRALFSSDCFGALLEKPVRTANQITDEQLVTGMGTWTAVDAPWIRNVPRADFEREVERFLAQEPDWILSSHLPPAANDRERLGRALRKAHGAPPFVGPDQVALRALMGVA